MRIPRPLVLVLVLVLLIPLAACAGSGSKSDTSAKEFVPIQPAQPAPIGKFLADLDLSMRYWTNLTLTARSEEERRRAREIEAILNLQTTKRIDELIAELESGPPRNRQRAATALGFTHDRRAQSPLLAALDDHDPDVVHNALLGLALLTLADTPTEGIVARLTTDPDPQTRSQAAYALRSIAEAGADLDPLVAPARLALLDQDPGVRVQAALLVGLAGDADSVERLADLLHDPEPLVRSAAAEGLVLIGKRNGEAKGSAARALTTAWIGADRDARPRLRVALVTLRGMDLGNEEQDWIEWANNLPALEPR